MFEKIITKSFVVPLVFSSVVLASDSHNQEQGHHNSIQQKEVMTQNGPEVKNSIKQAIISGNVDEYIKLAEAHEEEVTPATEALNELVKLKFLNKLLATNQVQFSANPTKLEKLCSELRKKINLDRLDLSNTSEVQSALRLYVMREHLIENNPDFSSKVESKLLTLHDYDTMVLQVVRHCENFDYNNMVGWFKELETSHPDWGTNKLLFKSYVTKNINTSKFMYETKGVELTTCVAYAYATGKGGLKQDIKKAYSILKNASRAADIHSVDDYLSFDTGLGARTQKKELVQELRNHGLLRKDM